MTEKEIFLSMIRRVLAGLPDEDKDNYYRENDYSVIIINANLEETTFYFDENGDLAFYE